MAANDIQMPDGEAVARNIEEVISDFFKQIDKHCHIKLDNEKTKMLYEFVMSAIAYGYCEGFNYCLASLRGQIEVMDDVNELLNVKRPS